VIFVFISSSGLVVVVLSSNISSISCVLPGGSQEILFPNDTGGHVGSSQGRNRLRF